MTQTPVSRLRSVLGLALGLLLSVGCGQQAQEPETEVEGQQEAALSRTRPKVRVSTGTYHSLAIRPDGTVWAAGFNYYGQLGTVGPSSTSTPVQVPGLTGVTSVAVGAHHSVALRSGGTV